MGGAHAIQTGQHISNAQAAANSNARLGGRDARKELGAPGGSHKVVKGSPQATTNPNSRAEPPILPIISSKVRAQDKDGSPFSNTPALGEGLMVQEESPEEPGFLRRTLQSAYNGIWNSISGFSEGISGFVGDIISDISSFDDRMVFSYPNLEKENAVDTAQNAVAHAPNAGETPENAVAAPGIQIQMPLPTPQKAASLYNDQFKEGHDSPQSNRAWFANPYNQLECEARMKDVIEAFQQAQDSLTLNMGEALPEDASLSIHYYLHRNQDHRITVPNRNNHKRYLQNLENTGRGGELRSHNAEEPIVWEMRETQPDAQYGAPELPSPSPSPSPQIAGQKNPQQAAIQRPLSPPPQDEVVFDLERDLRYTRDRILAPDYDPWVEMDFLRDMDRHPSDIYGLGWKYPSIRMQRCVAHRSQSSPQAFLPLMNSNAQSNDEFVLSAESVDKWEHSRSYHVFDRKFRNVRYEIVIVIRFLLDWLPL